MSRPFLKLGALALVLGGISVVPTRADSPPVYAWTVDNIDVDAMAARMPTFPGVYTKMRDEALAAYAKANPAPDANGDEAKKLIRLLTYLWVWGDCYREGLSALARHQANLLRNMGDRDPIVDLACDLNPGSQIYSLVDTNHRAESFAGTAYPDEFKMWYDQIALTQMVRAKAQGNGDDTEASDAPGLVQKWGQFYERQIRRPQPDTMLAEIGHGLLCEVQNDDFVLTKVHDEIDRAFAAAAPDSGVLAALDGEYLTDKAWLARSSDWASNVSDAQWAGFRDYLEKADAVLEAGYAKHPETAAISVRMLTVELGQGQGRDRMEQWFQRAIQADPQNTEAYSAKFWYLQPRWYGSVDDLVKFGEQGLAMPNPPPVALDAFTVSIAQAADQDPSLYQQPEVWGPVEKNYRKFLALCPQSITVRTYFAKHAADSGHWGIAKEQLDLLGDHWDRSVMSDGEHTQYAEQARNNPAFVAPPPSTPATTTTTTTTSGGSPPVTVFSVIGYLIGAALRSIF